MSGHDDICPKCGLPIGRTSAEGPLWTPQAAGVEVCGCPSDIEEQRARTAALRKDLESLEGELDKIEHHRP